MRSHHKYLIHTAHVTVLVDYGSMHTFIDMTFVDKIGVSLEDLDYDLVVLTPNRGVLTTKVCLRV